jgi:hypothetical protein
MPRCAVDTSHVLGLTPGSIGTWGSRGCWRTAVLIGETASSPPAVQMLIADSRHDLSRCQPFFAAEDGLLVVELHNARGFNGLISLSILRLLACID